MAATCPTGRCAAGAAIITIKSGSSPYRASASSSLFHSIFPAPPPSNTKPSAPIPKPTGLYRIFTPETARRGRRSAQSKTSQWWAGAIHDVLFSFLSWPCASSDGGRGSGAELAARLHHAGARAGRAARPRRTSRLAPGSAHTRRGSRPRAAGPVVAATGR